MHHDERPHPGRVEHRLVLIERAHHVTRHLVGFASKGWRLRAPPEIMPVFTNPGLTQSTVQPGSRGICGRAPPGKTTKGRPWLNHRWRQAFGRDRPATDENTASRPPPRASSRLRTCSQNARPVVRGRASASLRVSSISASSASCVANMAAVTTTVSKLPRRCPRRVEEASAKPSGKA